MRMDSYAGLDINSLSDRSGVEGLVLVAFLSIFIALAAIFSIAFIIGAIIFAIYFRKELYFVIKSFLLQPITWSGTKDFLITILIDMPLWILEHLGDIILVIWWTLVYSFAAFFLYNLAVAFFK